MHYKELENRVLEEATFFINNNSTVRATAKAFNISKSTVHKDLTERLQTISLKLFSSVNEILQSNKEERALRGGEATRQKYLSKRKAG